MKQVIIPIIAISLLGISAPAKTQVMGLTDAYKKALQHDPVLSQAKASFESAQYTPQLAKSTFMPQVSINGQYQLGNSSLFIGDVDTQSWSVNVSQSIYNQANQHRIKQAEFVVNQSDLAWMAAKQDLILRVANSYFKTLLAQADLSLSLAQESSRKTELERVKTSNEVGLASLTDVLQAQSSYDLSQSQSISNRNALHIAKEELATLIGEKAVQLKDIKENTAEQFHTIDLTSLENGLVNENLNIRQLEQALEVAKQEVEIQRTEDWVTVNLKASYIDNRFDDVSPGLEVMYGNRQDTTIGAYIDIPLYSGGRDSAQEAQALQDKKKLEQQLREAKQQVALNSRIQARNIENGIAQIKALSKAVKSNQAYLDAAQDSYKVGLADLLDVLTAETNTFSAKRNLTAAVYSLILAQLQLDALRNNLDETKLLKYESLLLDNMAK